MGCALKTSTCNIYNNIMRNLVSILFLSQVLSAYGFVRINEIQIKTASSESADCTDCQLTFTISNSRDDSCTTSKLSLKSKGGFKLGKELES